ncbi:hypothetical protein Ae201684P_006792 [Aphanomyces euteiches]|uniref:Uncharacterized protein n=1 Tax=Aphanomyces euteiches TaxID=100861 RepID=A0A6G0X8A5_9STRA|nr:hypothetical protein Ae201684_007205 [Aphanomyces euteiches]KAH9100596.1 hypothetical protein Ae201684P_006792 [Aphanomyces euteiches]
MQWTLQLSSDGTLGSRRVRDALAFEKCPLKCVDDLSSPAGGEWSAKEAAPDIELVRTERMPPHRSFDTDLDGCGLPARIVHSSSSWSPALSALEIASASSQSSMFQGFIQAMAEEEVETAAVAVFDFSPRQARWIPCVEDLTRRESFFSSAHALQLCWLSL